VEAQTGGFSPIFGKIPCRERRKEIRGKKNSLRGFFTLITADSIGALLVRVISRAEAMKTPISAERI